MQAPRSRSGHGNHLELAEIDIPRGASIAADDGQPRVRRGNWSLENECLLDGRSTQGALERLAEGLAILRDGYLEIFRKCIHRTRVLRMKQNAGQGHRTVSCQM